jgi:transglutaminase-like putative cysteine protease
VYLEPLTVRLRPRPDLGQRPIRFRLDIEPTPAGRIDFEDVYGNLSTEVWFNDAATFLELTSASLTETLRPNPFDYMLFDRHLLDLPMAYPEDVADNLRPYLHAGETPDVASFARDILATSQGAPAFLLDLSLRIAQSIEQAVREAGAPQHPERTLSLQRGACRDLAVLFIAACRSIGIAARFVSGYVESLSEAPNYLHAWAEVYLHGVGWRGYDPSQGLAVADRHVAVAAGPSPAATAPTRGSFRGSARSKLNHCVTVELRPSPLVL